MSSFMMEQAILDKVLLKASVIFLSGYFIPRASYTFLRQFYFFGVCHLFLGSCDKRVCGGYLCNSYFIGCVLLPTSVCDIMML